ncbi:hypothetical protein, partial [Pseudomonas sp. NDM]|uniref:hypothetical protein n=1 Tax=Pseudomonas sp. NDM TaxID=2170733 RepID=UPI001C438320
MPIPFKRPENDRKNLARSIAIFHVTTYIDAVYGYAISNLPGIKIVGVSLLAIAECLSAHQNLKDGYR